MPDGKTLELGDEVSAALAPEAFAPTAEGNENTALPGPDSLAALIANAISKSELNLETKKQLYVLHDTTGWLRARPCRQRSHAHPPLLLFHLIHL